jgi:hypothetical protein
MLQGKRELDGGGWEPPLPLILAAWWISSDDEKRERLSGHIHWAADHGGFAEARSFLLRLPEADWYHAGE